MSLQSLLLFVLTASALLSLFSIGLRGTLQDATHLLRRPGELLRALLAMNVLMPLFTVTLISLFDLTPAVKVALVALSVSPIPPPISAKEMKAGGTESYVIGLHIAIGVLAIIVVPLAMAIIGQTLNIPLQASIPGVTRVVFVSIVMPIAIGILVRWLAPAFADRVATPLTSASTVGLAVGIAIVWISAAPAMWSLVGNGTLLALTAFVLVGLALGHFLGGPVPTNRTSLAIATASRHPGVALLLARANFPGETVVVPAVLLYLLVNLVVALPYLAWTKRRLTQPHGR